MGASFLQLGTSEPYAPNGGRVFHHKLLEAWELQVDNFAERKGGGVRVSPFQPGTVKPYAPDGGRFFKHTFLTLGKCRSTKTQKDRAL